MHDIADQKIDLHVSWVVNDRGCNIIVIKNIDIQYRTTHTLARARALLCGDGTSARARACFAEMVLRRARACFAEMVLRRARAQCYSEMVLRRARARMRVRLSCSRGHMV